VSPLRSSTVALSLAAALSLGCGGGEEELTSEQRGQELFTTKELSPSNLNNYTCSTCHYAVDVPGLSALPGAPMAGATLRPTFWGGQENDLLRAINACRTYFMVAPDPLTADDPDARALYAFLKALEPGNAEPFPFTVVREISVLTRGNAEAGQALYGSSCGYCHGVMHTGAGRLSDRVPILPEDTIAEHPGYTPRNLRLVFVEKVRHGLFLGYGGDMPPLSKETLSDEALADVLEALGIYGE
jgi:thiosulfate dehydrogenase